VRGEKRLIGHEKNRGSSIQVLVSGRAPSLEGMTEKKQLPRGWDESEAEKTKKNRGAGGGKNGPLGKNKLKDVKRKKNRRKGRRFWWVSRRGKSKKNE